jgi:hypothetical protein
MSDQGIHYDVTHAEGNHAVQKIVVSFGDGHQVEISQCGKKVTVRIVGRQRDLILDASDTGCELERAVNLIRLYMGK